MEARRDMTLVHSSETSTKKPARQRSSWTRSADPELRLCSGSALRLELSGDVEVVGKDDECGGTGDYTMTFHELTGGCCRQFILRPKSSADADPPKVSL